MKTLRSLVGSVSVLFVAFQSALAWNESGHLQIAAIAYGELSAADRKACDDILTNHVKYRTWVTEHIAYTNSTPDNREVSLGFYGTERERGQSRIFVDFGSLHPLRTQLAAYPAAPMCSRLAIQLQLTVV